MSDAGLRRAWLDDAAYPGVQRQAGDIFFTRIADRFRDWIRVSPHRRPPNVFMAMITEPHAPPIARACVNDSYPEGGALTTMPREMLRLFPALPEKLEYRFIDRDLILWDVHANLIVDIIPNALALSDLTFSTTDADQRRSPAACVSNAGFPDGRRRCISQRPWIRSNA